MAEQSMTSVNKPPRVLISYSHDSTVHAERVLELANQLRNHGIDCMIDQYEPTPEEGGGWPLWMERQIEQADFVLCLCSKEYAKRFRLDSVPGVGKGVAWEALIVRNALYLTKGANRKFYVVQFDHFDAQSIPTCLQGYTSFVITELTLGSNDYEKLYRLLTNQPAVVMPMIGQAVALLTKQNEPAREYLSGSDFLEFQNRSDFQRKIIEHPNSSNKTRDKQLCEIWRSRLQVLQFAELEALEGDKSNLNSIQTEIELAKDRISLNCPKPYPFAPTVAACVLLVFFSLLTWLVVQRVFNGRLVEIPAIEVVDELYQRNREAIPDRPERESKLESLERQKVSYSRSVPFRLVECVIERAKQDDSDGCTLYIIPKNKRFIPTSRDNYTLGVFVVSLNSKELPANRSVASLEPVGDEYQSVEVTIDEISLIDFGGQTSDSHKIFASGSKPNFSNRGIVP